jgi:hypothetical protein
MAQKLQKKGFIDLHTHTIYSDGGLTPNGLVCKAKEIGLAAIAIADHDNIAATEVATIKGAELGIEVVPAIELTAYINEDLDFHILGYFINTRDKTLRDKLETYQSEREIKSKKVIQNLNKLGFKIDFQEVKKIAKGTIAQPHLAYVIVNKAENSEKLIKEFGEIPTTGEFIREYLATGAKAYEPRSAASPQEAIDIIHQAGGVAVLAHPCWNLTKKEGNKLTFDDAWIEKLSKMGLDGVEVYAHRETKEDTEKCIEHFEKVANKLKLVKTGGSDFHGFGSAGKELGFEDFYLKIPVSVLEELKEKVRIEV